MMDFLKSLAPSRPLDAGRAVAVLPSRFESDAPLRSPATRGDGERDDADETLQLDAHLQQRGVRPAGEEPDQTEAHADSPRESSPPRDDGKIAQPRRSGASVPHEPELPQRTPREMRRTAPPHATAVVASDATPAPALPARPADTPRAAREPTAAPPRERVAVPATAMRAAPERRPAPLSEAAVAQRASARVADTVVEISIGRIEVLAVDAPKREPARAARPRRQPTVALADYLRGGTGGAR